MSMVENSPSILGTTGYDPLGAATLGVANVAADGICDARGEIAHLSGDIRDAVHQESLRSSGAERALLERIFEGQKAGIEAKFEAKLESKETAEKIDRRIDRVERKMEENHCDLKSLFKDAENRELQRENARLGQELNNQALISAIVNILSPGTIPMLSKKA